MKFSAILVRHIAAAVTAGLVLSACGGGGGVTTASDGGLGGEPIKLGSVLTITNPAWDNSGVEAVNQAWTSYINEELGGIDGRPVQVEVCDDHGDPARTTQCLNNLVDSGVVGLVNNSSLAFGANALPAMEEAGLVNLGGWPITPAEYSSDYNFPTTPGASGSYPSLVVFARLNGAEKLAAVCTDTPAGQAVCESLGQLWASIGGGGYFSATFDPTAPDYMPVISRVKEARPDAVVLAVGEGPAPRMFKATQLAGIEAKLFATSTAATETVFNAAGAAANGTYFSFAATPDDFESEQTKTYRHVMETYAPDQELTNQTGVATSSMQFAYDVLNGIDGEITRQTVRAAAEAKRAWPGFLTHAMDPAAAPSEMPAVRNPYNLLAQYEGDRFTPVKVSDPGELAPYVDTSGDLTWIAGTPAEGD